MRQASTQEKNVWYSGIHKSLTLTFSDNIVLTNSDIVSESAQLEQALCTEQELTFGQCNASCFQVRILQQNESRFKGLTVAVTIKAGPYTRNLGTYKVESDVSTADRLYRDLVCYDALADVLVTDYSGWHNALTFPLTVKSYRDAFFNHVGITQAITTLPNDDMVIAKNFVADNFSGQDVLSAICEINACFGYLDFDNVFQYVRLSTESDIEVTYTDTTNHGDIVINTISAPVYTDAHTDGNIVISIPAGATAVPIYTATNGDVTIDSPVTRLAPYVHGSFHYEEFTTQDITQLQIRQTEDDIGAIVGVAGNTYIIQDNPLLYGKTTEQLTAIGTAWLNAVAGIHYVPAEIELMAGPWIELGDHVSAKDAQGSYKTFYVLQRTMSGITALMDSYKASGTENYGQKANSEHKNLLVLQQRTNELRRTVDETVSTVTNVQTNLDNEIIARQTSISQTAAAIRLEVAETTNLLSNEIANLRGVSAPYTLDGSVATFTARVMKEGRNAASEFLPGSFTWYKKEDYKITYLGAGYTYTYDLSNFLYGGSIIMNFAELKYALLLDDDSNILLDDDGNRLLCLTSDEEVLTVENDFTNGTKTAEVEVTANGILSRVNSFNGTGKTLESVFKQTAEGFTARVTSVENNLSDNYYTKTQTESQIKQTPHTITLGVSGTASKSTAASITVTLLDADGNLIDSDDGDILIDGNVVFTSQLTDGQTIVSGSNIHGGTLILGGNNNENGQISMRNSSNTEVGTWTNSGLTVTNPNTLRTSITTDGKLHVHRYASSAWREIGNVGYFTLNKPTVSSASGTAEIFGINALSANTAGLAICINDVPYYAMNTATSGNSGFDLTGYGFRHYFNGDIYCNSVFKTSNGYGWYGTWRYDEPYVKTGSNVMVGETGSYGVLYALGNIMTDGELISQHGVCQGSDIKLKTNISELDIERSKTSIMALRPVSYRYKHEVNRLRHGFIAQEVQKTVDWDAVSKVKEQDYLMLNYEDFIADLVKVVQNQEERIKQLEEVQ